MIIENTWEALISSVVTRANIISGYNISCNKTAVFKHLIEVQSLIDRHLFNIVDQIYIKCYNAGVIYRTYDRDNLREYIEPVYDTNGILSQWENWNLNRYEVSDNRVTRDRPEGIWLYLERQDNSGHDFFKKDIIYHLPLIAFNDIEDYIKNEEQEKLLQLIKGNKS